MNTFFSEHGTKIYGATTSFLGTLATLVQTGAFNELLSKPAIGWLGIFTGLATAVVGGMTMARGFTNSTAVRVAEAMQTAIQATPPRQGGFARPAFLAALAVAVLLLTVSLSGCVTNPNTGRTELTEGGKEALKQVTITAGRRVVEERFSQAKIERVRSTLLELQDVPDVTTVDALVATIQARIETKVTDPRDRRDFTDLTNILAPLVKEQVGAGDLAPDAVIRLRDFLGDLARALPVAPKN